MQQAINGVAPFGPPTLCPILHVPALGKIFISLSADFLATNSGPNGRLNL